MLSIGMIYDAEKYCNAETMHHFMRCNERHLVSEITSEMWSSRPGMKTAAMRVCDTVVLVFVQLLPVM